MVQRSHGDESHDNEYPDDWVDPAEWDSSTRNRYARMIKAIKKAKKSALRLFRPMPHQDPFFYSEASEKICRGGNRCLGGEQEIYDPVLGVHRRVDEIDGPFHVLSMDPGSGEMKIKRSSRPFVKGHGSLYRVKLSNGQSIVTTLGHRVLNAEGRWIAIEDADRNGVALLSSPKYQSLTLETSSAFSGFCSVPYMEADPWASGFEDSHPSQFTVSEEDDRHVYVVHTTFLRQDKIWDITVADYSNYECSGLVNANSGKTTSAAVLFASAAMGVPIRDSKNQLIPHQFPTDRPLLMWCIGWDRIHIGKTLYRVLFQPGLFKLIEDGELGSGKWRAYNPSDPDDLARADETSPSPPLIPREAVKNESWEKKGVKAFDLITLKPRRNFGEEYYGQGVEHDGTQIYGYSSKGRAPMGDPCDYIWIDEDIEDPAHVGEFQARLSDRKGRLVWSAFPLSNNQALMDMSQRAEEQADREHPDVSEVVLRFDENSYMDPNEIRKRIAAWDSSGETGARNLGNFDTAKILVYPSFSEFIHGIPGPDKKDDFPEGLNDESLIRVLQRRGGQPPEDWTRYLALDPGHSQAAVGFFTVPPPEFGEYWVMYDELYPQRMNADQLADEVLAKTQGQWFEKFIIDWRAGRQTTMGYGKRVVTAYSDAFEKRNLRCAQTGHQFTPGSDNVPARLQAVRGALGIRSDGTPLMKFYLPNLPMTIREFRLYNKKITANVEGELPVDKHNHLMDALGYFVTCNPEYVKPERDFSRDLGPAYHDWLKEMAELKKSKGETVYHFGPGPAPTSPERESMR